MRINFVKVISFVTMFCVYLAPTYFLTSILGFDVTKYIFLIVSIAVYATVLTIRKTITPIELMMFFLIILLCYLKKSIEPLSLIELMLSYRIVDYFISSNNYISDIVLIMCGLGIILYSTIYFNYNGRFVYTGLREINQSGFGIFLFTLIVRKYNKKIGNICMLLGLFTFSRNYLLCLIVFLCLEAIKNKKIFEKIYTFLDFKKLMILNVIILLVIATVFEYAYKHNMLVQYQSGFKKYFYILDYSNYFRFTTNSNLIKIYASEPNKLITGITEEEFYQKNLAVVRENNGVYRKIKPHNYFFSYLRIYGIFSIIIFLYLNATLKKIVNKNNYSILFSVFIYSMFLGVGFTNYWLYLTLITLCVYRNTLEIKEEDCNE